MEAERVTASTTIEADPEAVFAVLADPSTHAAIDGTGWVRESMGGQRLTAAGQVFRMAMYHPNHPDKDYKMANRVEVFDEPRAIAWQPGTESPETGELSFGGWIWRYDLEANGPSQTTVTLTYDWSAAPRQVRERIPFPPFGPDHLDNSLQHLTELVARRHWDAAYKRQGEHGVSWFQAEPRISVELLAALGVTNTQSVVDVGGGASRLVDALVGQGFDDVTVLDISSTALQVAADRLGDAPAVIWLHEDLRSWQPTRQFDVWHDRAVFHFLVDAGDRDRYLDLVRTAIAPGGAIIMATFDRAGPEACSGLPVCRYDAYDLASLLAPDFEVVVSRPELHVTPSGASQSFTWIAARARR